MRAGGKTSLKYVKRMFSYLSRLVSNSIFDEESGVLPHQNWYIKHLEYMAPIMVAYFSTAYTLTESRSLSTILDCSKNKSLHEM